MTDDEFVEITEALRESEARLEAVLSSLDDLVFELDESGTYLGIWTANDALLAAPRSELLGRTPAEVIGEDMGLKLKEITRNVLETGSPEIWEYGLEVPAGVRWFQSRVAPIFGPDGRSTRICLLVRDITEQKEAELEIARLLSREQLLTRLSEALPVGLFEMDLTGRITFANARVHKISGQPVAKTVKGLMAAVIAEDFPMLESALEAVFANQPVDDLEMRLRLPRRDLVAGGTERVCDLSLRALSDKSGAVCRVPERHDRQHPASSRARGESLGRQAHSVLEPGCFARALRAHHCRSTGERARKCPDLHRRRPAEGGERPLRARGRRLRAGHDR
jgi:PAS domain S-box-containing protein